MNEKASVSKEVNAKHAKVLEGLLKLPENKECADCRSRAPRWASINLGIFICLQCSGIHRSLGVHISKVRSTTLDTWLPEQVVFMQMMNNEKSNEYWEAELPPQYERNPIEKFIHNKYVDKKWASQTSDPPALVVSRDISVSSSSKKGIPKKARRYSLDEETLAKDAALISAAARIRSGSLDLRGELISPRPAEVTPAKVPPTQNAEADLFSLLYVTESQQDRTVVPPSRWATFESIRGRTNVGSVDIKEMAINQEQFILNLKTSFKRIVVDAYIGVYVGS